jgi:hypothetical protein
MKRSLTNILKKLVSYWKVASAIIGIVGAVYGGIVWYNAYVIRQHDKEVTRIQSQTEIICRLDSLRKGQLQLQNKVGEIKTVVDGHTKQFNAINKSYVNLLKETGKIDELLKYYESLQEEIKKNNSGISYQPIL